jgi:hypothetical protein
MQTGLVKIKERSIEFSKALNAPIDVFWCNELGNYFVYDGRTGEKLLETLTGEQPSISEVEIHIQKLARKYYHQNVAAHKAWTERKKIRKKDEFQDMKRRAVAGAKKYAGDFGGVGRRHFVIPGVNDGELD